MTEADGDSGPSKKHSAGRAIGEIESTGGSVAFGGLLTEYLAIESFADSGNHEAGDRLVKLRERLARLYGPDWERVVEAYKVAGSRRDKDMVFEIEARESDAPPIYRRNGE